MTQPPSGTVTFLFTDIEGSTRLAQQHRDHWEALRARHDAILHQAMQAHNGQVFEIIGDAFSVAFHTAIDALNASIDAQRALAGEAWHPAPIKVRMGIHTGTAQPSGSGGYKGYSSLARTQRLMSAGHGGQVLVSMTTEQLLREGSPDEVTLRDMGEKRLKDLVLPERIYQVVIPDLPADFPPLKTLDAYRNNLPLQMTSFIGRAKEMAEVTQAVHKHRLVTLTGPGGSGKTRLALQVAADLLDKFPDGVWFVGVGPLSDPGLVAQTVLSALGAREQPGRSALQSVLDHVRERTMLLVLDNCEHLLPACAEAVQALLSDARALKIIATSREALKLDGELTWSIPAMAQPDPERLPALDQLSQYEAVQLFIERAALVQPSFAVSKENAPAIAQICFHLDGIPLAIELAAARMRALSPGQVSARLDDRFQLLTGGKRGALPQHQTLRLAIDWSYNLLSPVEQEMLQRLSIFAGGWSLEAAEALATRLDPALGDWLDLQSNLVDKSLVAHNVDTERYSMLESVQHYALKKLEAGGRLHACRSVHQLYFLEMAEYVDREAWDVEKEAASIDMLV
ncbi:MAG TPA: adenylate/guanylate cyclase domain-containing protein, partial [Anaerolineae bacterium]|nr:adenylate/guanylate cyclase domain-containing protein [Anaerolineae bacterium]